MLFAVFCFIFAIDTPRALLYVASLLLSPAPLRRFQHASLMPLMPLFSPSLMLIFSRCATRYIFALMMSFRLYAD